MNALLTRLLQHPMVVESLAGRPPSRDLIARSGEELLRNPQAIALLAGLGAVDGEKLKSGIGRAVSSLLSPAETSGTSAAGSGASSAPTGRGKSGVAVTAVVSLAAVAGAVAALGTVSAVALSSRKKKA
jgi:hypothetical protein